MLLNYLYLYCRFTHKIIFKMRLVYSTVIATFLFASFVASVPRDYDQQNRTTSTHGSLGSRKELPQKTPSDIAKDIKESAYDVKDWAENNYFIRAAKDAVQPVHTWVKDTANTLKDKSFRDMFEDSKTVARRLDENVGEWLDTKSSNVEEFKK
ncbi:hypothetical protein Anas_13214 [Armadillidium nasatum]|uniref:Uncharacterized protein n=1 Tax=Armadillidium nasatum TaxID=96803 RepID=A0A5N5T9C1_9CRUS|nr:hypothetical protein Anas_13214 [Armadillidium nasatum]